jgi:hypothetical protein
MIIFLEICLRKARLCIVVRESGVSQIQSLSSSDTRVKRPRLETLLPLQTECDGLNKHIHSLASQMHENLKLRTKSGTCVGDDTGVVRDKGTESTRVGRLEVVVETVVCCIAVC